MKIIQLIFLTFITVALQAQRSVTQLDKNWKFTRDDHNETMKPDFDDREWQSVTVPHDWAI